MFDFPFLFLQGLRAEFALCLRGDLGLRLLSNAKTIKIQGTFGNECILHHKMEINLGGAGIGYPN
jgi:hypothetical protein